MLFVHPNQENNIGITWTKNNNMAPRTSTLIATLVTCLIFVAISLFYIEISIKSGETARDYQIEVTPDSIKVYEGVRYLGGEKLSSGSKLDSLIRKDKQK